MRAEAPLHNALGSVERSSPAKGGRHSWLGPEDLTDVLSEMDTALSEKAGAVREATERLSQQEKQLSLEDNDDDDDDGEELVNDRDNELVAAYIALMQERVECYARLGGMLDNLAAQREALGCFSTALADCCGCCLPCSNVQAAVQLRRTNEHVAATRLEHDAQQLSEYIDAHSAAYRMKLFMDVEKVNIDAELEQLRAQTPGSRRAQNHARIDELRQREKGLKTQQREQQARISWLEQELKRMYTCPGGAHQRADAGIIACCCITPVLQRLGVEDPRPALERAVKDSPEVKQMAKLAVQIPGGLERKMSKLEEGVPGISLSSSILD